MRTAHDRLRGRRLDAQMLVLALLGIRLDRGLPALESHARIGHEAAGVERQGVERKLRIRRQDDLAAVGEPQQRARVVARLECAAGDELLAALRRLPVAIDHAPAHAAAHVFQQRLPRRLAQEFGRNPQDGTRQNPVRIGDAVGLLHLRPLIGAGKIARGDVDQVIARLDRIAPRWCFIGLEQCAAERRREYGHAQPAEEKRGVHYDSF